MNLSRRLLIAVAGAAVLASCATTPKPATPATTPAPAATSAPSQTKIPAALAAELTKAKQMKAEIDQNLPSDQRPAVYREGASDLSAGEQAIGTDNATAKAQLDVAIADFQKVIDEGQALYRSREQQVAKAREAALAAKADRAVPDQWSNAQSLERQAAREESSGQYLTAYGLLGQSIDGYDQATESADRLQAEAQRALRASAAQIGQTKSGIEMLQQGLTADEFTIPSTSQGGH